MNSVFVVLPHTLLGILASISMILSAIYFGFLIRNEYKKSKAIQSASIQIDADTVAKALAERLREKKRSEGC